MEAYKPPYTISETMLELVSSISEKIGRVIGRGELESRPHLRRNNRIRSIHSSLKIEANSLSLTEVRDVINGRNVLGDPTEIWEVKNAYRAYDEIRNADPYSLEDLKRLHGIMTEGIVAESGVFRRGAEGVFSGGKCIFIAPPPELVPSLMQDLFDWMKRSRETVHPLILSAVFHYEFVFIHPFADGNGRMARLWHTVLLSNWREVFEYISLESQIESFQEEYYEAIAKCHVNGNSDVFIEFMLRQIDRTLENLLADSEKDGAGMNLYLPHLLAVMQYDIPYTAADLMEKLGLKSKETFRKNYMHPAIEQGFVIMTIPDKPTSRNQQYIRKV